MPTLTDPHDERFAWLLAAGLTPIEAYRAARYNDENAQRWATSLAKRADITGRVDELRLMTSEDFDPSSRTGRIAALQDRCRRMRQLMDQRAVEMADVPGGDTGLLVEDLKGKVVVYRFDRNLLAEIRAHERQVAQELGQWMEADDANENLRVVKPNFDRLTPDELRLFDYLHAKAESPEPDAEAA
jgi:hypothetical protein